MRKTWHEEDQKMRKSRQLKKLRNLIKLWKTELQKIKNMNGNQNEIK
jgi:hypothetical protein